MKPIEAYASLTSVAPGDTIDLHVYCEQGTFTYDVLRRSIADSVVLQGSGSAPALSVAANAYEVGCGWPVAFTITIGANWKSGYYIARLTAMPSIVEVPFVVRAAVPGSTSKIVFALAISTLQAYNFWGGRSLYGHMQGTSFQWADPRAYQVSFDRPFESTDIIEYWELPFIQWLEKNGYVVEFCTSVDLHADRTLLHNYQLFLSVGHDEYWSKEMRDQVEAFVANGGNAAFFSGNVCWWQVRFENANRTMVCYKDARSPADSLKYLDELETTDPGRVTTNWSLPPVNRPENSMTGVGSTSGAVWSDPARPLVGYQIRLAEHWVFAGTGLQNGDELGRGDNPNNNVVGYESDGLLMTGSIGCSDVVLVDATVGGAQVYLADGTGQFGDGQGQAGPRTVYSRIGTGSTHVVAGDFGPGCYTDLFCYDRNAGSAELHRYDRDGNFAVVKQLTGLSKTWTQLASGRLSGHGLSDVIAYDSGAGAIEVSSFDTQGQFSRFARVTGFGSNWTHLGTGHFGPQYWYQDILLFDRTAGRLQIHSIDSLGKLSLLKETTGLGTTWSHVVIGKLLGSLYSDVLLYDEQNGIGEFRRSDGQGNLAVAQRYTGWSQGWTHITAGRFGGGRDQPGLMFYDSVQGRGELYAVGTGATLAPLGATLNLGTGSQQILSGHFESNARPQADGSDGSPANFMVLATSDLTDWGKPGWATMGIYRKGGTVFTAASTNWPRGLSLDGDRNAVDIITDNILTRLATVDSGAPVLKNASFETWSSDSTADFWLDEGSGSLQRETGVIKSGQAAARIDATAGDTWISQDSLSFEQGVTYRLGCWVQSSHAGVTVRLQSTESWIDFAIAEHSGGGQWEYLTAIGQVSDAGPLVSGRAKFQVAAGSVAVFDDVKLDAL